MLTSLPPPVFTLRHYIFHGEHCVYVLNRETLALEYVGHVDMQIDAGLAFANKIQGIELVNDNLLAVRYRNTEAKEFVQLIALGDFKTIHAQEIKGELLAVAANGNLLAVRRPQQLVVLNLSRGKTQSISVRAPTNVSFSPDNKQLAYLDGDVLYRYDLTATTLQLPQRTMLTDNERLWIDATAPASELSWGWR